jgi:tetratricopeptide (TPR) repeat protein
VQLFVERGRAARSDFSLTPHNALAVARICHQLDGIPLAIELAAARLRVLTAEQIADRVADRFHLLTGGTRTALPRHQTLRALIDWSYDALSETEQVLFRRLSAFSGGWTLDAAEEVCAGESIERGMILDLLDGLIDKSLVLAEEQPVGVMRYRFLETLRAYAAERLRDADEASRLANQHTRYFVELTERTDVIRQADWGRWRREAWPWLLAEQDNLRAILGACRDGTVDGGGNSETGLRLCACLWWFWIIYDRENEAWKWYTLLLDAPASVSPARFWAVWSGGILAGILGNFDASERLLIEASDIASGLGDEQFIVLAASATAQDLAYQGRLVEAEPAFEHALERARKSIPRRYLPTMLYTFGWIALRMGHPGTAEVSLNESVAIARELGDEFCLVVALQTRGLSALVLDDLPRAEEDLQQAQLLGDDLPTRGPFVAQHLLGRLALVRGDADRAATHFGRALQEVARSGLRVLACESLQGLAFAALARGHAPMAIGLLAAEAAMRASIKQVLAPDERQRVQATLTGLPETIGQPAFETAWRAGQSMSMDDAIAYAITGLATSS